MPQLRRIRQIEPDDAGAAASVPDVRLQRVVPAVSMGIVRRHEPEPEMTTSRPDIDLGRSGRPSEHRRSATASP